MATPPNSTVVFFEHDTPVVSFLINENGVPFDLTNYNPSLLVADPEGTVIMTFPLTKTGGPGELSLDYKIVNSHDDPIYQFVPDVCYKGQIYLEGIDTSGLGIGLYDIVDPNWLDYIPPEEHVPGWWSGTPALSRTTISDIPVHWRQGMRILPQDVRYIDEPDPEAPVYPPYIPPPSTDWTYMCEVGEAGGYFKVDESYGEGALTPNTTFQVLSEDGNWLFVTKSSGLHRDAVGKYQLDVPFDLSNLTYIEEADTGTFTSSFCFSEDGYYMAVTSSSSTIKTYLLAEPWDISMSTRTLINSTSNVFATQGLAVVTTSRDGRKFFIVDYPNGDWHVWDVENWDFSTATNHQTYAVPSFDSYGVQVNHDGTELIDLNGQSETHIKVYELSPPYDITSPTYVKRVSIPHYNGQEFYFRGMCKLWAEDTPLFVGNWTSLLGFDYSCSWKYVYGSLWTGPTNDLGYVYSQMADSSPSMVYVESIGRMFFSSTTSKDVWEFSISNNDPSTLAHVATWSGLTPATRYDMKFGDEGNKLFVQEYSYQNEKIAEYQLSAPYDLSSPVRLNEWDKAKNASDEVGFTNGGPRSFLLSDDGTTLWTFVQGSGTDKTYGFEYTLSTPWSLASGVEVYRDAVVYDDSSTTRYLMNPNGDQLLPLITIAPYALQPLDLPVNYDLRNAEVNTEARYATGTSLLSGHAVSDDGKYYFGLTSGSPYYLYRWTTDAQL